MRQFDTGATRDTAEGKHELGRFLSPEVMRCYSDFVDRERAYSWAAGVFEGEGCVYPNKSNPPQPRLQIRMTDRDILDRFCAIVGQGKVYGPYKTKQGNQKSKVFWKDNYTWQAHGQAATETARAIFPYLGIRRMTRLIEVFNICRIQKPALLPPDVINEFSKYMHKNRVQANGSLREPDNWKRGIPLESYMASSWRHMQDVWLHHEGRGDLAQEPIITALCATLFNVQGYLHELLKNRGNDNDTADLA